jgi:hypothetical protein
MDRAATKYIFAFENLVFIAIFFHHNKVKNPSLAKTHREELQ